MGVLAYHQVESASVMSMSMVKLEGVGEGCLQSWLMT